MTEFLSFFLFVCFSFSSQGKKKEKRIDNRNRKKETTSLCSLSATMWQCTRTVLHFGGGGGERKQAVWGRKEGRGSPTKSIVVRDYICFGERQKKNRCLANRIGERKWEGGRKENCRRFDISSDFVRRRKTLKLLLYCSGTFLGKRIPTSFFFNVLYVLLDYCTTYIHNQEPKAFVIMEL